jgi:hypothetical protein
VAVDDLKAADARSRIVIVIRRRGRANGTLGFGASCLVARGKCGEEGTDGADTKNNAAEGLRRHERLRNKESPMYVAWTA